MSHKLTQELNLLERKDLTIKLEEFRRELFGLRLSSATTHVKDYSPYKKLRKNIARCLTLLQQKNYVQEITADKE